MRFKGLFILSALSTFAGCTLPSAGPDIGGMYQVTYHTLNEAGCAAEGPPVADPPYIQLERETLLGVPLYTFAECDSASSATCDGLGIFGLSFQTAVEDGWIGEIGTSSQSGGGDCHLGFTGSSAILQDNGDIRIEITRHADVDPTLDGTTCSADVARERGATMPCERFEVYVGSPTL